MNSMKNIAAGRPDQGQRLTRHCPMARSSQLRQILSPQPARPYQFFEWGLMQLPSQCSSFTNVMWGAIGRFAGVLLYFAQFALLLYLLRFSVVGKYSIHAPVSRWDVDRCLKVGGDSVAMVTSLLLRRLLPYSVAAFTAPTLWNYWSSILRPCLWSGIGVGTRNLLLERPAL